MSARYPRTVLGTCCLPWQDGKLDRPLFERSVRNLVQRGLRDLYIFGTAGEGHAVTEAQFREVTGLFVETLADAATYFERPEMVRIFGGELPQHGANVGITVLRRLTDYTKDTAATD